MIPRRVLIVEDVPEALAWMTRVVLSAFPGCAVDEARSVREVESQGQGDWDLALVDLGLASVVSGAVAPPSPTHATTGNTPATAAAPVQDLRTSARRATKVLEDLLGPACEPLALQLEKCKSVAELEAKIQELRPVVASMRSEKKAEEFVAAALGR